MAQLGDQGLRRLLLGRPFLRLERAVLVLRSLGVRSLLQLRPLCFECLLVSFHVHLAALHQANLRALMQLRRHLCSRALCTEQRLEQPRLLLFVFVDEKRQFAGVVALLRDERVLLPLVQQNSGVLQF